MEHHVVNIKLTGLNTRNNLANASLQASFLANFLFFPKLNTSTLFMNLRLPFSILKIVAIAFEEALRIPKIKGKFQLKQCDKFSEKFHNGTFLSQSIW